MTNYQLANKFIPELPTNNVMPSILSLVVEFLRGIRLENRLVICFWFNGSLGHFFQAISGRLPEREKEKRKDRRE